MQDYKLLQDNDGLFDLELDDIKVFKKIDGFETAITLQIFSDKRCTKDDLPNPIDRRGWIGDILTKPKYELGSHLYLKDQSRDTQLDRNEVKAFIIDGMNYFIKLGALTQVVVELLGNTFTVMLYKGSNLLDKFNKLWRNTRDV